MLFMGVSHLLTFVQQLKSRKQTVCGWEGEEVQWPKLLTLVLRRQKQVDLCELEARLVYTVSSKSVKTT